MSGTRCLFASDLHGKADRYVKLFRAIEEEAPAAVFLGGDLFPGLSGTQPIRGADFLDDVLVSGFRRLREAMGTAYPRVFVILGNDDGRFLEAAVLDVAAKGLWNYAHDRALPFRSFTVYGYSYVPPTPFMMKDWERYDVSRYVDPGCVSPEDGQRSVPVPARVTRHATIEKDLQALAGDDDLERAVLLLHTPPYRTKLDRAALDGNMVDHVPLDVHVGSIAVRRFIESRQPLVTLHGHVHEAARLSGDWRDRIGRTHMLTAAHDGPELALVSVDLGRPAEARRRLL